MRLMRSALRLFLTFALASLYLLASVGVVSAEHRCGKRTMGKSAYAAKKCGCKKSNASKTTKSCCKTTHELLQSDQLDDGGLQTAELVTLPCLDVKGFLLPKWTTRGSEGVGNWGFWAEESLIELSSKRVTEAPPDEGGSPNGRLWLRWSVMRV